MGERDAHCLTSRSARCRGGHWWPSPLCTAYLCSDSQCTTQCTPGCTCPLTRCMPMTCPPPSRYHCTKVHIPPMSCSQPLFPFNVQEPLAREIKNKDFQRCGTQPDSVSTIHTIPRKISTIKTNLPQPAMLNYKYKCIFQNGMTCYGALSLVLSWCGLQLKVSL